MEAFKERLIAARKRAGLSQYELARRVGVTRDVIAQCEAGRSKRPREVEKIAKELGVSPGWLLFGDSRIDDLSKEEIELILKWKDLDEPLKEAIKTMIMDS